MPLLGNAPNSFASILALNIAPSVSFSGEVLFEEETTGEELFFVYSGEVEIVAKWHHNETAPLALVGDGGYFGDVALLLACKRTATARCSALSFLYMVEAEPLAKALEDSVAVYRYMHRVAAARRSRVLARNPSCESLTVEGLAPDEWLDEEDAMTESAFLRQQTTQGGGGA